MTTPSNAEVHQAIEDAARNSYGRLIAYLSARSRNVAAAQDALGNALRAALETWPLNGLPDKPEAWLLTAARRQLIDAARHARVETEAVPVLLEFIDEAQELADTEITFPDERLKLLFICAHPAIDPAARTPLMLQVVLGLDAARIASAFLVQPTTMGQRLTRAKTKIRDAGIAFEVPETRDLPSRLDAVLEAIYATYGRGWDDIVGADPRRKGFALEAINLGSLLLQLLPDEPEVMGLLSLMLHCEARREARRDVSGNYVPLSEQDVSRWSWPRIEKAEYCLKAAAQAKRIGRFQLQAAIQSVHAQRAQTGKTNWEAIALLYEGLVDLAPTVGTLVSHAAAVAEACGAEKGLGLLEKIPDEAVKNYQPYWALAAHLLTLTQRMAAAKLAYSRAIGLCEEPAMRDYLARQAHQLS